MKKITIQLVTLMLAYTLGISISSGQTVFSANQLSIFYPTAFDSIQTLPSIIVQNEPVVSAGANTGWRLNPTYTVNGSNNIATVNCSTGVDFYGTGEVTGTLRRNNTSITLWNTDNFNYNGYGGQQLYQSHPWVMGVRADGTAFGVIADNTWQMTIAISDTNIVFNSTGPAFRIITFEAATPQLAVEKLASLTGKIKLPPIWSLGYQQCRYSYMSDTQVKGIVDSFRINKLPCDVIWMDIDYMDQYKIFTFSPSGYPNPNALNNYLHANNFHSIWMIDPGVKQQGGYSIYDQGTAGNYWVKTNNRTTDFVGTVWPGNCVFPDFTMPATRTWWSGLYKNFMATGADGVWNDMNEPSVFNGPGGTMPTNNWHRGGGNLIAGTHLRYHNIFGRLMVQASREGILAANPTKRPFVLSRSNCLGGQQFAATWTGDNVASAAHMQLSVPMILTMGLSGQPIIGADVTGYSGSPSADLIGQWMALGTFYPFYRNHSEKGSPMREPWVNGPAIEQVCRIALQRRYRLLPYLYTLTQEASTNGLPIMRPLFFAEPSNLNLRSQQQAFMLGNILMIIPKWATGVNTPTGTWTSISLVGEDSQNDPYQPDVKIKSGTILPLGQIIQSTANFTTDSLTLIVSLDANKTAHGVAYSDSGEGYSYQNGAYLMRQFNVQPLGNDSVVLTALVDSGNLSTTNNTYRVGLITGKGIVYTNWTKNAIIKIPLNEAPYGGTSWPIAGKIEAENYDTGGQGIAYNDSDTSNNGGQYRQDGVDIEGNGSGGYNVGWTVTGEWMNYKVNVTSSGVYTLQSRIAAVYSGTSFHVNLDTINISGSISVPSTGGYKNWQTLNTTTTYLSAGLHTMKVFIDTGGLNLDYLIFTGPLPPAPVVSSNIISGTLNSAFNDTIIATNNPVSYRSSTLPNGLSLDNSTGIISGIPSITGTFIITDTATNSGGFGTGTITIIINPPAPVITSNATATEVVGTSFTSYQITATNNPASFAVTNLPAGLTINTAGLISGTPTTAGTFTDTIKASNAGGTGTKVLTITINAALINPPVITSNASATGMVGTTFTAYQITATNNPTSFAVTNLPAGLTINTAGLISGTPTTAGTFTDTIKATNAGGTGTQVLTITITAAPIIAPVITSNASATGMVGTTFTSYQITATNNPASFAVTNLPAGLTINAAGLISGTPTTAGTFTDTIKATNTGGTGTQVLTITINAAPIIAPVITSNASATGMVGTTFSSYQITATNNPNSFAVTNLPAGLTINAAGLISGTPTTAGTFVDTIKATNGGGTDIEVITIIIANKPLQYIQLIPNPVTQGNFIVTLPGWNDKIVTVEICNFIGKIIQTNTTVVVNEMIKQYVYNLCAGVYIIVIKSDKDKIVKVFIVK